MKVIEKRMPIEIHHINLIIAHFKQRQMGIEML